MCHLLKYSTFFFIYVLLLVRGVEPLQFDPQAPALPPKERRIQFPMDEHVANGTLKANTTPAQTNSGTATPNAPPRRRDRKQTDSVSSSFCSFLFLKTVLLIMFIFLFQSLPINGLPPTPKVHVSVSFNLSSIPVTQTCSKPQTRF